MKPREKMALCGAENLSDEELLTLLIGSGTSGLSAREIAAALLEYASGSLSRIASMPPAEMCTIKGLGQATALEIAAGFELSRRALREIHAAPYIKGPQDIFQALRAETAHLDHEEFWALYLSASGKLLARQRISQGGLSAAAIDQRIIFRRAYALSADAIALCHNHPSGSLSVSPADIEATRAIARSCALLGFRLTDHIVIAGDDYTPVDWR